jgi:hypothetical protein
MGIVLDDCTSDLNQRTTRYLMGNSDIFFVNGMQYVTDFPKELQSHVDVVFAFPEANVKHRESLRKNLLGAVFGTDELLRRTFEKGLQTHEALVFDCRAHREKRPYLFYCRARGEGDAPDAEEGVRERVVVSSAGLVAAVQEIPEAAAEILVTDARTGLDTAATEAAAEILVTDARTGLDTSATEAAAEILVARARAGLDTTGVQGILVTKTTIIETKVTFTIPVSIAYHYVNETDGSLSMFAKEDVFAPLIKREESDILVRLELPGHIKATTGFNFAYQTRANGSGSLAISDGRVDAISVSVTTETDVVIRA